VSLGGQYVTRIMHVPPSIIIEMGVVGLRLWFVMAGAVLICSWRVVWRLRGSAWLPLTFVIFWYIFLLLLPFTFVGLQAHEDFRLECLCLDHGWHPVPSSEALAIRSIRRRPSSDSASANCSTGGSLDTLNCDWPSFPLLWTAATALSAPSLNCWIASLINMAAKSTFTLKA
jgi:hypothetical protein